METGSKEQILSYQISSRVRIHLMQEPRLVLPQQLENEVERIWQEEKVKKNLFNSLLFNLVSFNEDKIFGHFVEYRHFIASRKSRAVQEAIPIFPLCVSGLCVSDSHILIGKRDTQLATYGGCFECVPSGGIGARAFSHGEVDFFMQLIWELEEEAHIGQKSVQEIHPIGLFYSPQDLTYDIGMLIRLDLKEHERHADGSVEYPLLQWLSFSDWELLLADKKNHVVPLSRSLWHTWRRQSQV